MQQYEAINNLVENLNQTYETLASLGAKGVNADIATDLKDKLGKMDTETLEKYNKLLAGFLEINNEK